MFIPKCKYLTLWVRIPRNITYDHLIKILTRLKLKQLFHVTGTFKSSEVHCLKIPFVILHKGHFNSGLWTCLKHSSCVVRSIFLQVSKELCFLVYSEFRLNFVWRPDSSVFALGRHGCSFWRRNLLSGNKDKGPIKKLPTKSPHFFLWLLFCLQGTEAQPRRTVPVPLPLA